MKYRVVINRESGSVPDHADERFSQLAERLGIQCEIDLADSATLQSTLAHANRQMGPDDRLIVWGGDGTIACALSQQTDSSPALIALPGGTMNLLHKRMYGDDLEIETILTNSVHHGIEKKLPCGIIQGERFYVGALFGRLTQLAKAREATRHIDPIGAVAEIVNADGLLDLTPELALYTSGENIYRTSTLGVFVGDHVDTDLEVGIFSSDSIFDLTSIAVESLISDWRTANGVEYILTKSLDIDCSKNHPINMTLDGEIRELEGPLRLEFVRDSGRVITTQ